MNILYVDIETTPNLAYTWGLFKQNISLSQLVEPQEVLCFAAKWGGSPTEFYGPHGDSGKAGMIRQAHALLDKADVIVHYNGDRFDVPHLNREFLLAGLTPPSPFKSVDLLKAVKKTFRFTSNKLEHVSRAVGLAGKVQHEGFDLWTKCMAGDADAWARMAEYNVQDVDLLEDLYTRLRPWIPGHPNVALYDAAHDEALVCPACGSEDFIRSGFAYTQVTRYQRFRCNPCGKWFRDGRRNGAAEGRNVA